MKLLEDAAKAALREAGVEVPRGVAVDSADAAAAAARELAVDGGRVAIKALVAAGRRGKGGGVTVCPAPGAGAAAARILELDLDGTRVRRLYVEQAVEIDTELYLAFAWGALAPRLVVSRHGGVDVEVAGRADPAAIVSFDIDPVGGLRPWQAAGAWDRTGVPSAWIPKLAATTVLLWNAFRECDALMLELNPLAITADGEPKVVGTMMEVDDNALYRHPPWEAMSAESAGPGGRPLSAGERAVALANRTLPGGATRYIELDGDIGLLVSGGGASLYQHDLILEYGGRPANHTDFSPAPTPDKLVAVIDAIFGRPQVRGLLVGCNVLQLARCDLIVEALAIVMRRRGIDARRVPIVIRLFGPMETEARAIASQFPGVRYLPPGTSLAQACRAIVEAVRGLSAGAAA
jgi:succinyl-CoA synthetase beta subunit